MTARKFLEMSIVKWYEKLGRLNKFYVICGVVTLLGAPSAIAWYKNWWNPTHPPDVAQPQIIESQINLALW